MEMRRLQPEDLAQYDELLRYAFQVTREDLVQVGWEDEEILQSKSPVLKSAEVLGWFDEGRLVSQIAVYPMRMNVHGAVYSMGYVTGVATYPEYTARGLIKTLMQQSLVNMRAAGQSLSLLYPYSIPYYRHMGWQIISDKMGFSIKDTQLPKGLSAPGRVRRVKPDDADVLAVHERFALQTHGCILRDALVWEEYWRWDVDDILVAVYYGEDEVPQGYMVYLLRDDVLRIKELVCLNFEAWRGLWAFVTAHDSMVDEVVGNNFYSQPIAYWLDDSATKETVRPYMMGRIVDVVQFLSGYRFAPPKEDVRIRFVVTDGLLSWNEGPFTALFGADGLCVAKAGAVGEADGEAALSIGTLTTMLLGYKRPEELYRLEQLAASPHTVQLLESLLFRSKPYVSENM